MIKSIIGTIAAIALVGYTGAYENNLISDLQFVLIVLGCFGSTGVAVFTDRYRNIIKLKINN